MSNDKDTLLAKWLVGEITPDELLQLKKEVDLDALKEVLDQQKNFDLEVRPAAEMWDEFEANLPTPEKTTSLFNWRGLAVVLIILALIGGLLYFMLNRGERVVAPPGKTQTIPYADGSRVELSPGSELTYDESKWDEQRELELKGQAFFDVSKGSPFKVQTPSGTVEVLGTSFDIWAFDDLMRVQCFTGKVRVTHSTTNESAVLAPREAVFINKSDLSGVDSVEFDRPDWLRKVSIYQKTPTRYVIKDIERFYNIDVDPGNIDLNQYFSGIIPLSDIDKALDYLTKTMQWTYERKDTNIRLLSE